MLFSWKATFQIHQRNMRTFRFLNGALSIIHKNTLKTDGRSANHGLTSSVKVATGVNLNIKIPSYQYRKSHYKDKTVGRFIFIMENSYTEQTETILRRGPFASVVILQDMGDDPYGWCFNKWQSLYRNMSRSWAFDTTELSRCKTGSYWLRWIYCMIAIFLCIGSFGFSVGAFKQAKQKYAIENTLSCVKFSG